MPKAANYWRYLELPPFDSHPTSFAILFIAANSQLQSPSAEDDVLSSAGRDQIAAFEDEREEHQDEIERVPRQRRLKCVRAKH